MTVETDGEAEAPRSPYAACEVAIKFADGEYLFRLPIKQIAELQEKCVIGIGGLFARVLQGRTMIPNGTTIGLPTHGGYYHNDLRETIRLALIGGGTKPYEAVKLIERYVDTQPLREAWNLAAAILAVCIEGYKEPAREERPPPGEAPAAKPDGSTSPPA